MTHGWPAIAAISTIDVQNMVDSLPTTSTFQHDRWLVDSGADISICFNHKRFSYIDMSDIDQCAC